MSHIEYIQGIDVKPPYKIKYNMSHVEYLQGIDFIKRNSGTPEEEKHRLSEWEKHAKPLVKATK